MIGNVNLVQYGANALQYVKDILCIPEPSNRAQTPVREPFRRVDSLSNSCWYCLDDLFNVKEREIDDTHSPMNGREVVAHKKCPPVHRDCLQNVDLYLNGVQCCPTCREPLNPNAPKPQDPVPPLHSYVIQWIRWGISKGAQGLRRISGEVLYNLFWSAILATGSIALNAIVDSSPLNLMLGGPVLGGLMGIVFGTAMTGAVCNLTFDAGTYLIEQVRSMAKIRFTPKGRIVIGALLCGIAAALSWRIAIYFGKILIDEWAKICLTPCDVSKALGFLWKLTMNKGLRIGLSEVCVVTLAQIEAFAIASLVAGVATWGRRIINEEIPRFWNEAVPMSRWN